MYGPRADALHAEIMKLIRKKRVLIESEFRLALGLACDEAMPAFGPLGYEPRMFNEEDRAGAEPLRAEIMELINKVPGLKPEEVAFALGAVEHDVDEGDRYSPSN